MNTSNLKKTLTLSLVLFFQVESAMAGSLAQGSFSKVEGLGDNQAVLQDIATQADRSAQSAQKFFAQLGFNASSTATLDIKAYANNADMLAKTPASAAKDVNMLGYFNHATGEIGVQTGIHSDELNRILSHEIIHKFFHESLHAAPPAWLDEGLAEFLSRDPYALESMQASQMPMVFKMVLEMAKSNHEMLPLDEFFKLDNGTFYGRNHDLHYAMSYAFAAYLLNTHGPRVLGNFVKDIASGENPGQWLQTKLGVNAGDFQAAMLNWAINS